MWTLAAALAFYASAASAEPERYDYVLPRQKEPPRLLFPKSFSAESLSGDIIRALPKNDAPSVVKKKNVSPLSLAGNRMAEIEMAEKRCSVQKRNDAKRKSIATLLRQYNKRLSDAQAQEYAVLIIQISDKFKQNPLLVASMIVNESSARRDVVSRGGDYGLMQIRWRVHRKKIRERYPNIKQAKDMFNPKNNITVGVEILSDCRERADYNTRGAILYYSAGNERLADKVLFSLYNLENLYMDRLARG
jgi:soluble lytic murein transglycosylase-like protein